MSFLLGNQLQLPCKIGVESEGATKHLPCATAFSNLVSEGSLPVSIIKHQGRVALFQVSSMSASVTSDSLRESVLVTFS